MKLMHARTALRPQRTAVPVVSAHAKFSVPASAFSLHNILNQSITSHNVTTHVAGHELSHEHMTRDPAPTSTTLRVERRTAVTDRNSDMYMLLLYMNM